MATSGSGRLEPNNGSYSCPVDYEWNRDSNGIVHWKAQIYAIGGGTGQYDSSPCWTSFFIRGGKNAQNDLTGNLAEYCADCSQCAQFYQGNILWQHNDVRGGALSGTIDMGASGGTLKLGYFGQRNGSNTSEEYLTWTVDPAVSPPTGLNVTNITATQTSITANVSISGWGVGSGTRYRELQVWEANMSGDRRYQAVTGDATSGNITCNNSSSGTLTITQNTKYWIGGYASNGSANTGSQPFGTVVTLPPAATCSFNSATKNSIKVNWAVANQGGERSFTVDYRLDSGSWVTVETISTSGAKSGTFTITGLKPNSTHGIDVRTHLVGGSTIGGQTITASTTDVTAKWYGSVSNSRKRAKKMYCSVNNTRKKVLKIYGSVNGARALCYEDPNL